MPFFTDTAYKSTSITLTGYKQQYLRLKGYSCIYFEYEVYLLHYTIKVKNLKKPKLGCWLF